MQQKPKESPTPAGLKRTAEVVAIIVALAGAYAAIVTAHKSSRNDTGQPKEPHINNTAASNSVGGDMVFGNKAGANSFNSVTNQGGSVNIGGTQGAVINSGANSGLIFNGSSNITVNIWTDGGKYGFLLNQEFASPLPAAGKLGELKTLARTEEFQQALRPFVASGSTQPTRRGSVIALDPDKSAAVKPISYTKLNQVGALKTDLAGEELLAKMGTSSADKDRPRWPMRSWKSTQWSSMDRRLVQNAQGWINAYHEEMVQIGMLSE